MTKYGRRLREVRPLSVNLARGFISVVRTCFVQIADKKPPCRSKSSQFPGRLPSTIVSRLRLR